MQFPKPLGTLVLLFSIFNSRAQNSTIQQDLSQLQFRFIGPEGNRAIAVAGVPGDPMTNYLGAASGGLWKTDDAGITWNPITDTLTTSSIGAIAIAPSAPDQVWIGTGETFIIRPAHAMGDGVYKSMDGGKSWQSMGLEKTGRIGRIVVHPNDPETVYVAALGHTYGPQQDKGIYKTTDGGDTWQKILFVDEYTGASDLTIDPINPDIIYAAMWSVNINTWGLNSGGPGGGIYKSNDGGETWTPMIKKGLPGGKNRPVGKTAVALCHEQPNVVYALFEIDSPELYRSEDHGDSWTLMSQDHTINERAPYYTRIAVTPDNPDEIYFLSVRFSKSIDGGKTLIKNPPRGGGDNHDMWIDPANPARMMVAHDGCLSMTSNRGKTFQRIVLPIAQMYHVSVDNEIPYYVYGNRQDGWSYRGPSNSRQRYIPVGLWHGVGGCESGFAKPDPFDNDIVWSGCYDGGLERYNHKTGQARDVRVWPEAGYGWAPADLKYRWHWNFPLSFSMHTRHRVYVGSQFVHQSDDGGQSWQIISPDLTLNDKTHQQSSGGVAIDNLMTFDGATLFAVEESPIEPGVIWTGSNDGQVQITKDAGKTWANVTSNIKNLPPWGTIASIHPSKYQKGTVYLTVDLHQMGDFGTYAYKTEDYGISWVRITENMPQSVHGFAHVLIEDPKRQGLLYLGVDNGLYVSFNDGDDWFSLKNNLPSAPIYWLTIQEEFDDLVMATYGRGFYILDDLGALRQYNPTSTEPFLMTIRSAYRFSNVESIKTDGPSFNAGENPPDGASINYYLPKNLKDTMGIKVKVLDERNNTIRSLEGSSDAGVNRIWWDLRYEPTFNPKLRTIPPGRPWVALNGEGWRPLVTWDLDLWQGQLGPKVVPGVYTIELSVGDKTYRQPLSVKKDPNTEGTIADIEKQVALALELRDAINTVVEMINKVEILSAELNTLIPSLRKSDLKEAKRIQKTVGDVAAKLYDIHLTGAREDAFRSPMKLYGRLSAVASDINGSGIDFKPTNQQGEVYQVLNTRLTQVKDAFSQMIDEDIESFNKKLNKLDMKINIEQKSEKE